MIKAGDVIEFRVGHMNRLLSFRFFSAEWPPTNLDGRLWTVTEDLAGETAQGHLLHILKSGEASTTCSLQQLEAMRLAHHLEVKTP